MQGKHHYPEVDYCAGIWLNEYLAKMLAMAPPFWLVSAIAKGISLWGTHEVGV